MCFSSSHYAINRHIFINSVLSNKYFVTLSDSTTLYLAKSKKNKSAKIFRASDNCAHELGNCVQSQNRKK